MNYKKKPAAPPGFAEFHFNPRQLLRAALIVAAYLFAFIILDFITKQFEELRGIVAWYPPAGLTYTLLLVFGVRFAPAVTIALLISSLFIYRMPQPPYLLFLWAFILSLIYSMAAALLRQRIRIDWQLRKLRDVTWLVVTAVFVSALLAILSVLSSALSSDMPRSEVLNAIFHWWIGETVGVLTVTPFLLIYVMPWVKRFAEGQPVSLPAHVSFPRPTLSAIGQAASLAFTLYWVFGTQVLSEFQPLFLITLPLIWIALQRGFKGVTVAILALNFGVIFALWFFRFDLARLGELQLLMIINCIVGLLMGAVVTERKQTEESLREGEEKYRRLFENTSLGIFQSTLEGRAISVNPAFARMFGYASPENALENIQNVATEVFANPNRRDEIIRLMAENPDLRTFENLYRRKDGSTFTGTLNSMPILDANGSLIRVEGIIEDITQRKQAEENLKEYNTRLEARVEARTHELREAQEQLVRQERLAVLGQLAGGVGHELRNPLGIINNAIYYLRMVQPDADEKVREYLGIIETETHTADKIISDLLDFSRIKSVDLEPVHVSELVRGTLERFPPPENVQVTLILPENLPTVFVDPRQMTQVLGNLVLNACQAMNDGGRLTVDGRQSTVDGQSSVVIAVKDTGTGITPENMKKLFEPLFTTKPKGIGLGLAVSKKLVEANDGRIEVESEPGKGSTFTVWLPIHNVTASDSEARVPAA
jgi:PAS domain S-box-containing protein